jgi:hypothetical protein
MSVAAIRTLPILLLSTLAACGSPSEPVADAPLMMRAVTFNTGTPECDQDPEAEYSCEDAAISAEWYGTGLAHLRLIEDVKRYFEGLQPDLIGFQELFHPPLCAEIPPEFHRGFICERWQPGDPTVAQEILGPDYQVACHRGRPDKCLAVHRRFGRFRGCDQAFCGDHLEGGFTQGCGGGTRVGRGRIDLRDGRSLVAVNLHGTSGITLEDQACRVEQFEQVFVDLQDGSGMPGANGARSLVLGDLNTDPGRTLTDPSAQTWREYVGEGRPFRQLTAAGLLAAPTYQGLLNIDHVASDVLAGRCVDETPTEIVAFDHRPIVCELIEAGD